MLVPIHHDREDIYDEIDVIQDVAFENAEMCKITRELLKKNEMPKNYGLNETNVMFRAHHNTTIVSIDKDWWDCIKQYSKRDQLSFSYCLYKNGVSPFEIAIPNIRSNEWFYVRKHNKHHD